MPRMQNKKIKKNISALVAINQNNYILRKKTLVH
jgi:hypothetical protein